MADQAPPVAEPAAPVAPVAPAADTDDGFSDASPAPVGDKPSSTPEKGDPSKPEGDQKPADKPANPADDDETAKKKAHDDEMAKQRIADRERKQQEGDKPVEGEPANPDAPKGDEKPVDPKADAEPANPDEFLSTLEADIAKELGQIEDEQERRVQTIEARQYLSEAKTATNQLLIDHSRVVADIPIFNPDPKNPDFNKSAYEYFVNQYQEAHTTTDRNGVIWPKTSLYQFMQGASELLSGVSQKSALKGQQAEAKMRGRAEVPSGTGERSSKADEEDDPFLKGFGKAP